MFFVVKSKKITRKSLRFLGKPRVCYSKNNPDNEESKKESRIRRQEKQLEPPYSCSVSLSTDMIYYSGMRWKIGDIVGLRDKTDHRTYYAQIRGFLQDQYCVKSACLTWLLPTLDAPDDEFDADHYYLGPEEEIPRKMEYMEFICHAPSSYYKKPSNMPASLNQISQENGFLWTKDDTGVCYKIDECKRICDKPRFVPAPISNSNDEIEEEFYEPKRLRSSKDDEDIRIGDDYRNPNFEGLI